MSDAASETIALVQAYYAAFNRQDYPAMLAVLAEDVAHFPNQGAPRYGRESFAAFLAHMERCYSETLRDIVVMSDPAGERAAAEFMVHGTYLATDSGLPEARGQTYQLPAGSFLEVREGCIQRITTYYNLQAWLKAVGG